MSTSDPDPRYSRRLSPLTEARLNAAVKFAIDAWLTRDAVQKSLNRFAQDRDDILKNES